MNNPDINTTLKDRLYEIRKLLIELEFLKGDINSIIDFKEEYFENVVKESNFFYRLHLNYLMLFIIDVHKLIDRKENYNILSLIDFCKINRKKITWNRDITIQELESLEKKLESISTHFSTISTLRNKYYAHNDKNKYQYKSSIKFNDLWVALAGLQEIFARINVCFDNHHWEFKIQYRTPREFHQLNRFKKVHDFWFQHFRNCSSEVSMNELTKIMQN